MYSYIIVDDEVIIRKGLMKKVSSITSLELTCVGEAPNGIVGLKLIEEKNPDIIISDMKMSKMNGVEFLERIRAQYKDKAVIVVSSYKDFEYMSKAIESRAIGYVLKPFSTEEIEKQLKKAVEFVEQQKSISDMSKKADSLDQTKANECLLSTILNPWDNTNGNNLAEHGYDASNPAVLITIHSREEKSAQRVKELGSSILTDINYKVIRNSLDKNQLFFLMYTHKEELKSKMEIKAEHIALHLQKQNEGKSYLCISKVLDDFTLLHKSYKVAEKMLKSIKLSDKKVILYEKFYQPPAECIYEEEEINKIFLSLKYYPNNASAILKEFFAKFDRENHNFDMIEKTCRSLVEKINQYGLQNGIDVDEIMEVFLKRYLFCDDMRKIEEDITEYTLGIIRAIGDDTTEVEANLTTLIKEYVIKNYNKKMTLQTIASEFYISSSQCSSQLKQIGEGNFSEFITKIRIEKAKKLLSETNIAIDHISGEIGYMNPKYFFKIFKKTTGYTPAEYRSRHKGGNKYAL